MTLFNAKFFARLSILSLPLVLMGAHGNCDIIIGPDGCEEIALECEDGEELTDTDGDGCADSCIPLDNCLAFPVCEEGETEVSGPSECLQDDAVCYESTMCASTIWCTGPDDSTTSCYDDSECGSNEFCSFEDDCGAARPDGSSDEDALVACLGTCVEIVDCPAIAIECEDGEFAVDSNGDGCVDSCEPIANCEAYPVCDEGHTEVSDSSGCLQDDAVCYERSMCGYTIWCTGPDGNIDG